MAPGDLITTDGQLEWRGLLMGAGTAYGWRGLDGWRDLPGVDSGNVARPGQHGSWPGRALAQERMITYTTLVRALVAAFPAAVAALEAAIALSEDGGEEPLVVSTLDEQRIVYGQVTSRVMPVDKAYRLGHGQAVIQWVCSDPRKFSLAEHSETVPQPQAGTGLQYPLVYPLDYGAPAETGNRTLTNAGNVPAPVRLDIVGPCTLPAVSLGGLLLEFDIALAAGEVLTIDTAAGTVLLNGVTDRTYTLTSRSTPLESFELPPGDSVLSFRAGAFGGAATCTVTWRDAWM